MQDQRPNVLVVTDRSRLKDSLERDSTNVDFNLKITDCEYRCSMLIEQFRPDYIVIDCALGPERIIEFSRLLYEDPRIPFVKIIVSGNRSELPAECDKMVFALVGRQFTARTINKLIERSHLEMSQMM
jgi:DNA-binding NtrC family response regulator